VTNPGANTLTGAPGSHDWMLTRGVSMGSILPATAWGVEAWTVLGCNLPGCRPHDNSKGESGTIVAFNRRMGLGGNSYGPDIAKTGDVSGYAWVQNCDEWASATQNPGFGVSRDNGVVTAGTGNTSHVIVWHATLAGFFNHGRLNVFYDEKVGSYRQHRLMSLCGNNVPALNTKHDVFTYGTGASAAEAALHTGGWAYLYGVGCRGEFARYGDAGSGTLGSSFSQAFPGIGAKIGTAQTGGGQDPLFANYAATTSAGAAGAGGGDYALTTGSPAKAMLSGGPLAGLPDLGGVTRTGAASAGAFQ
jgi:hypothetical protein